MIALLAVVLLVRTHFPFVEVWCAKNKLSGRADLSLSPGMRSIEWDAYHATSIVGRQTLSGTTEHPKWSHSFVLEGTHLNLVVYMRRMAPTELEVRQAGSLKALAHEDLFFDGSTTPYFRVIRRNAYLAYVAFPGAGSGEYASAWRIWDRGHRVSQLGTFMFADLRQWFTRGVIREVRPTKYATDDVVRVYPNLFEDRAWRSHRRFLIRYWFDPKRQRFLLHGIRVVRPSFKWPYDIRMPGGSNP